MTIKEYIEWSIHNRLYINVHWILSVFTYIRKPNEFLRFSKDNVEVFTDNWVTLTDIHEYTDSLSTFTDTVNVTSDLCLNVNEPVSTTYGVLLTNLILLVEPFKNKIGFMTENISIKNIENNHILPNLKTETIDTYDISVSEYIKFSVAASYMRSWGSFVTVSSTLKSILPPPGLDAFKKQLLKEFADKYGKDPLSDPVRAVEFESRLMEFDADYMKGDPTYGIVSDKKVMNARKKQYLMIGYEKGFDTGESVVITSSLNDGYPKDKEALSTLINQSRAGSYDRGHETQDSGVVAGILSDATLNITIDIDDCDVVYGYPIKVTNANYKELVGRYYVVGKKTLHLKNISDSKKMIGKTLEFRSPKYCKAPNDSLCKICCGDVASRYEGAIAVLAMDIGGRFLNGKMKGMHSTVTYLREFTIRDMFSNV